MKSLLHTTKLEVGFRGRSLIRSIDLELRAGEVAALIGANGTGKSTLLRALVGLHVPLAGKVMLDGNDVHAMDSMQRARAVSVVLTGRPQAGWLDVRTLVSLGRQPWTGHLGSLKDEDRERVRVAMERTGTMAFAERDLGSLSDGEAQKVLIARALAQDAPVMVLDEPTAFLDLVNRITMMHLLRDISHSMGRAILLSTHDLATALRLCDRILLVHDHQLWSGTSGEAISSGMLDRAFSTEGLRFDANTASLIAD